MLPMFCWLFIAAQPTRKAFCNWIELLSYNEMMSESIITFHIWPLCVTICHCVCECWWHGLSPVSSVCQAPGNLGGKGRASDAWVILVPHPERRSSETNQNCTPCHQRLGQRQGQISPALGRAQTHSRQAKIFKNICYLQQMRGISLPIYGQLEGKPVFFPCISSSSL